MFFRDTCEREAAAAGIAGLVRNLQDGRVEAVFEGEPDAVERMVRWARTGPPRAVVEHVEVHDEEPTGETTFRVTW